MFSDLPFGPEALASPAALLNALQGAETDPAVRVLLILGEGDMFTAGNDVGEFAAMATGSFRAEPQVGRFLQALAQSSRPLIAAVQGRAAEMAPGNSASAARNVAKYPRRSRRSEPGVTSGPPRGQ